MSHRSNNQRNGQVHPARMWLVFLAFIVLAAGCAERGKATAPNFGAVKDGMTKGEVEALLGPNNDVIKDIQFSQVIQQNPQAEWRRWKRPDEGLDQTYRYKYYYLVGFVDGKVILKAEHRETLY